MRRAGSKCLPVARREGFVNDNIADISDAHDFGVSWLADTIRAAGTDLQR